jgi:hypothetical protein
LRDAFFLVGVSAAQEVGFGIEVGEAPSVGGVFGGREAFAGDLDFGDGGLWFGGERFSSAIVEGFPFWVAVLEIEEKGV